MEVKETVIRLMTRLAMEHGAVNLSQGFTDEAPVYDMVWSAVAAMLGGTEEGVGRLESMTLRELLEASGGAGGNSLDLTLKELLREVRNPRDQLNQYSFPFGIPELRHAIADYTEAFYGHRPIRRSRSRWCSAPAKGWRSRTARCSSRATKSW